MQGDSPFTRAAVCLAIVCCGFVAVTAQSASAVVLPAGFRDEVVFEELAEPTAFAFAPDERVFVAEKSGRILLFDGLSDQTPSLFADLRTEVYDTGDRGLLGLTVDPEFPTRPYVYALYTYDHILGEAGDPPRWGQPNQEGDVCSEPKGADACLVSGRLTRLTFAGGGTAGERKVLVEGWCQQFSSHSVGDVRFGPGGALYASGGDGAAFSTMDYGQLGEPPNPCGDPPEEGGALRSQDLRTLSDPTGLNGSVIRIDPDTGEGLPGNPRASSPDPNLRRIVAYGFRNPFRLAIDPEGSSVYVGNVGWITYEEIDRFDAAPTGLYNSGWPCFEGLGPTIGYSSLSLGLCASLSEGANGVVNPFFLYRHDVSVVPEDGCRSDAGSALSGLAFYDADAYPDAYDDSLFFADSVRGCIFVMRAGEEGEPDPLTTTAFLSDGGLYPGIDLEVGPGGYLYYAKLLGDGEKGAIHRIAYDPNAPVSRLQASPVSGAADPLEVHLDASASTDPQGEDLSFAWDLDGDGTFETSGGDERTEMIAGPGPVTVAVRVSDEGEASSVSRETVHPGNTPPTPTITGPAGSKKWRVGERIEFSGTGTDTQDGNVPTSRFYWKVRLLHCPSACHGHPLQVFPGVKSGSFLAPDHDYPAQLEISLTTTDDDGLSATTTMTIDPRPVDLQIESDPPGLALTAGVASGPTPFELRAIERSRVVLSAPVTAELGGKQYAWKRWSDGGARTHTIFANESRSYTAMYEPVEPPVVPEQPPAGTPPSPSPPSASPSRPQTALGRRPPARTRQSVAKFSFSSKPPGASFRCQLDRRPIGACRSPQVYRGLKPGRHTFRVFAVGPGGLADATPATHRWQVLPAGRGARASWSGSFLAWDRRPPESDPYSAATWVCHLGRIGRS